MSSPAQGSPVHADAPGVRFAPFGPRVPAAVRNPAVVAWLGLVLALACLFKRLGYADPGAMELWISSDTLYPVNVFTDIFRDHYSISGWHFSIAPCWFPDLALTGIFWGLTHNVILATLFAGFIQVPFLLGAVYLVGHAVHRPLTALQSTILLLVTVLITMYVATHTATRYPPLYELFMPVTHVGITLLLVFGWGLAFLMTSAQCDKRSRTHVFLLPYVVLCFLGGLSDLLFFPQMLAPLTASVLCLGLLKITPFRRWLLPIVVGWSAAALGAVSNRALFHAASVSVQSDVSRDRILTALLVFVHGFTGMLMRGDVLHLLAVIWLAICSVYVLQACIRRKREPLSVAPDSESGACVLFLCCLLSALFSVIAIVGGGSNALSVFRSYIWSTHYLHPLFFIPLFGIPVVLTGLIESVCRAAAVRFAGLAVIVLTVAAPAVLLVRTAPAKTSISAYRPPLVEFLDGAAAHYGLRCGYAGYWQARLITLLSQSGLRAYAVDGSMNPLLWISNEQWYSEDMLDRRQRPPVDFVVLDDPAWGLTREAAERVFGPERREISFEKTRVLIYGER